MAYGKWLAWSISLIILSIVCLAISKIFLFLGFLFFLPAPDLFLTGVSGLIATIFCARPRIAIAVFLLSWVCLGLNKDLPAMFGIGINNSTRAEFSVSKQLQVQTGSPIALSGDLNSLVVASGKPGNVEPQMTVAGNFEKPKDWGDIPSKIDLVEMLWHRGLNPIIEDTQYPSIHVSRVTNDNSIEVTIKVLSNSGEVTAAYKRCLWLPNVYPGKSGSVFSYFNMALSFNLWKWMLHQDQTWINNPRQEVEKFLTAAINSPITGNQKESRGLVRSTTQSSEFVQIGDNQRDGYEYIHNLWMTQKNKKFCSGDWSVIELGAPGWQSRAIAIKKHTASAITLVESYGSPYNGGGIYCDDQNRETIVFGVNWEPNTTTYLRIRTYSNTNGSLLKSYYLDLPNGWTDQSYIQPESWRVDSDGTLNFNLVQRGQKVDQSIDSRLILTTRFRSPP